MIDTEHRHSTLLSSSRHNHDIRNTHSMVLGGMLKKRNLAFLLNDAPLQYKKMRSTPKAIRFAESHIVATRMCTHDDLRHAWYSKEEYEAFKEDCRDDIRRFNDAHGDFQLFDHARYCIRGLEEQITPDAYYAKKERRDCFLQAILREQELHVKLGINEPESLKAISTVQSRASKEWALELGVFDSSCTSNQEVSD